MPILKIKIINEKNPTMLALYTYCSTTNTFNLWRVVDDEYSLFDPENDHEFENEFENELENELENEDNVEDEFAKYFPIDQKLNWTETKCKTKKRKQVKTQILVDGDLIKNRHHPATKANCVKARNEMRLFKAG